MTEEEKFADESLKIMVKIYDELSGKINQSRLSKLFEELGKKFFYQCELDRQHKKFYELSDKPPFIKILGRKND